jgi:hypothetical protein
MLLQKSEKQYACQSTRLTARKLDTLSCWALSCKWTTVSTRSEPKTAFFLKDSPATNLSQATTIYRDGRCAWRGNFVQSCCRSWVDDWNSRWVIFGLLSIYGVILGHKHCMCMEGCMTKRCACKKAEDKCNSRCHHSKTYENKWTRTSDKKYKKISRVRDIFEIRIFFQFLRDKL